MDFHLTGKSAIMQTMIQLIPFLNARAQGMYKLGRTAIDPKTAGGFWLRGAMLSTAALALAYYNDKDKRYRDLPNYEKYQYFHFWVGKAHIRIPIPFEVGIIFGTAPVAIMETLRGTEDLDQLKKWAAFSMTQTLNVNPIPQVIKPGVEVAFNRDSFTNRPIVPQAQQKWVPRLQYGPRTSETAKALGKVVGASPRKIDHLVQGYFGDTGTGAMLMLDQLVNQFHPDRPAKPSQDIRDFPGLGRFFRGSGQPRVTRYESEFYDLVHEADTAYKSIRQFRRIGQPEAAKELLQESRLLLAHRTVLGRTRKQLGTIYKQMQRVYEKRGMSSAEKRRVLDNLLARKQRLVKRAVLQYKRDKNRTKE